MKQEFIALKDCVISGHPGIVRKGDRIALTERQAKYILLKGWIEPAPAPPKPAGEALAEGAQAPAPEPPAPPAPRRTRRSPKKT